MAMDDLIHDPQLIERSVSAVLLGHRLEYISREFDNGRNRNVMWFVSHMPTGY
jgi:hypothetical protein